jgi:multiple antibiotic resistance protein
VLAGFALFGHVLLASMGISFAAFRIAGGIVLFVVGARMIFEEPDHGAKAGHSESGRDLAVFPLAMPYLAGPATTLAVMVATQQETFDPGVLAAKIGVLALVMVSTVVILLGSGRIQKILGHTGSAVIGRVMGILLAALAAESVVRGVTEAFKL